MKKNKTIVCGTAFGTFYAEAVKHRNEEFELVGFLANGSERSKKCAKKYNVPLYRSVDEIPQDIDVACIAIRSSLLGGTGTDLALKFLERGVHVILEQPIHHKDLLSCFKAAKKNKCCFMTGNLYVNMPEVRRFLQVCQYLKSAGQNIEFIKVGSSVQALYPFADVLRSVFPSEQITVLESSNQLGDFKIISGKIGSIPYTMQFNNVLNPRDPDNYMQLLHSFTCFYPAGRLELVDTRGPLLWYPRLNMPWDVLDEGGLPAEYPDHMNENFMQILTHDISNTEQKYYEFVEMGWVEAIALDLDKLKDMIENPKKFLIKAQQEQSSSTLWHELTEKFGFAILDEKLHPDTSAVKDLYSKAALKEERGSHE